MKFVYDIPTSATSDGLWREMQDTSQMIQCIPGIEEADETSSGRYDVRVVTKVGPISLRFKGVAQVNINPSQRLMDAKVSLADSRSGNVYGRFSMSVPENAAPDDSMTTLHIESDVVIAGKLGELAQPLIKRKAQQIVHEFSENLRAYLERGSQGTKPM